MVDDDKVEGGNINLMLKELATQLDEALHEDLYLSYGFGDELPSYLCPLWFLDLDVPLVLPCNLVEYLVVRLIPCVSSCVFPRFPLVFFLKSTQQFARITTSPGTIVGCDLGRKP